MGAGRPEHPLDPLAGPVQRFAWELRQLREKSRGLLTWYQRHECTGLSFQHVQQLTVGMTVVPPILPRIVRNRRINRYQESYVESNPNVAFRRCATLDVESGKP